MRKYHNRKIKNSEGLVFDSKKECLRWAELQTMQAGGLIFDLRRQVKYVLIPTQRTPDLVGERGGIKKGKLLEREVAYIADFVYMLPDGKTVVEDVKGYKKGAAYSQYTIKRKLMLWVYGIQIKEI